MGKRKNFTIDEVPRPGEHEDPRDTPRQKAIRLLALTLAVILIIVRAYVRMQAW